ncbi:hypothetical protein FB45DRAFT_519056 [Roridomyces roridus]|uniref:Telomeric single stranded DNA binding POT1/Cdc13 domain-containing protein n=1 Tax=Roridomyces roridus TaxID=1738132 RepID=A0AAD7BXE0_9AGAR|nr:hypothetical protein FB45DRAFT_519056 [Roridomyces roridus]
MKRAADEPDLQVKRKKANPFPADSTALFKDPAQERHATDLLNWTTGESGFISGKVQMKWPPVGGKYRIVLETFSLSVGAKQFEVHFAGRCADKLANEGFQFQVAQQLRLSLRGADCKAKQPSSTPGSKLPITLCYDDGVALEVSPNGSKIDTWFVESGPEVAHHEPESEVAQHEPDPQVAHKEPQPEVAQDDWFSTPKETAPPALVLAEPILMDIDEESVSAPAVRTLKEPSLPLQPTVAAISSVSAPAAVPKNHEFKPSGVSSKDFERRIPLSSMTMPPPPPPPAPASSSSSRPPLRAVASAAANNASISAPQANRIPTPPAPASVHKGNPVLPPAHAKSVSASILGRPLQSPTSISTHTGYPQHVQHRAPPPVSSDAHRNVPSNVVASPPVTENLSKKQRKRREKNLKRREEKNQKKASAALAMPAQTSGLTIASSGDSGSPMAFNESISAPVPLVAPVSLAETKILLPVSAPPAVIQTSHLPSPPPEETVNTPHPIPKQYSSIVDFKKAQKSTIHNVIGVVTSFYSKQTNNGNWSSVVRIVDRTSYPDYLSVNCFNADKRELPVAKAGDIIALIGIKPSTWNGGINGVGFHDHLRWAVYRDHAAVDMEDVTSFSLYDLVDPDELAYCAHLEGWWRGMQQSKTEAAGTVYQIEAASHSVNRGRQHLLLAEVPYDTYFDCTVEVYSGHPCDRPYSIYVTDYKTIPGAKVFQKGWCPPGLSESMLRIEMWEQAGLKGPNMLPGEFYSLRNVRMLSYDGHPQGKLVEPKIEKLDIAKIEEYPHLKALLERKKSYGDLEADEELKLIAQCKDKDYLTCVVELLHVDPLAGTIYITDYTQHTSMPPIQRPWARGLDGYVLKVMIEREHTNELPSLEAGRHYRLKSLRLENSITAREFRGRLGGSGRIDLVNPRSSLLEEWKQGLIQRKIELKHIAEPQPQVTVAEEPSKATLQLAACAPPSNDGRTFSSISQVRSNDCPSKFVVCARVIDFFPPHLSQLFIPVCRKCGHCISDNNSSCIRCNDVEDNDVRFVSIFRILIDDGKDKLEVSISGDVPLLEGFGAAKLDEEGTRRFSERMKPLIGPLLDANGLSRNLEESTEPSSPMTFMVDSWKGSSGMAYGLLGYES